jgi:hypothetical protein
MVLPTALRKIGSRASVRKFWRPTKVPPTIVASSSDSANAWTTGMTVNRTKNASVGAIKTYDQACLRAKRIVVRSYLLASSSRA